MEMIYCYLAGGDKMIIEKIPNNKVIWQSIAAKTYQCPVCNQPIHSQYEGECSPTIKCEPDEHTLEWSE